MLEIKSQIVPVRLTPTQEAVFRQYAAREGLRLSAWLREVARERVEEISRLKAKFDHPSAV